MSNENSKHRNDILICGRCLAQFSELHYFVDHKNNGCESTSETPLQSIAIQSPSPPMINMGAGFSPLLLNSVMTPVYQIVTDSPLLYDAAQSTLSNTQSQSNKLLQKASESLGYNLLNCTNKIQQDVQNSTIFNDINNVKNSNMSKIKSCYKGSVVFPSESESVVSNSSDKIIPITLTLASRNVVTLCNQSSFSTGNSVFSQKNCENAILKTCNTTSFSTNSNTSTEKDCHTSTTKTYDEFSVRSQKSHSVNLHTNFSLIPTINKNTSKVFKKEKKLPGIKNNYDGKVIDVDIKDADVTKILSELVDEIIPNDPATKEHLVSQELMSLHSISHPDITQRTSTTAEKISSIKTVQSSFCPSSVTSTEVKSGTLSINQLMSPCNKSVIVTEATSQLISSCNKSVIVAGSTTTALCNIKEKEKIINEDLYKFCTYENCIYKTRYRHDLKRHYRKHSAKKPFSCNECKAKFNRKDKLKIHLRTHTGYKPYTCSYSGCLYKAVEKSYLIKHNKMHTDERLHSCDVCDYKARSNQNLVVHKRTHSGISPYKCTESGCLSSFKTTSDLKRHKNTHLAVKPFSCEHCPYTSAFKNNLKNHSRYRHSDSK